ncbi:MAG TPA: ABC transporter permease [Dehalococcoidia bacterium]|nr:ABC transporter permease [Dehalococcoidia bacterium]
MATDVLEVALPSRLRRTIDGSTDLIFKILRIGLFYVGLILVWHLVASAGIWEDYQLPPPADVWDSLRRSWENGRLQDAIQTSMERLVIGFAISFVIGIAIGAAMGSFKYVDETVGSLVLGCQSLPSVCWLPLALLWFGLSEQAIIFVVLMGSVGSIAISARDGVRSIPPLLKRAGRTLGANPLQMLRYVILPGMIPSMVQGLKLGWSFAWRSLMAAELLYVSGGLGFLLQFGRELNNISQVVAVMLVIVAIGVAVDRVIFGRLDQWVRERWGLT